MSSPFKLAFNSVSYQHRHFKSKQCERVAYAPGRPGSTGRRQRISTSTPGE